MEKEIFILMGVGAFMMLALSLAIVAMFFRAQKKLLLQKMKGQELMIQQTILAQEEERRRIAKDLHDEVGSRLNFIFMYLQQIRKASYEEKPRQMIADLTQVINKAIDTTRTISHDLLPPTLEEIGLREALRELCLTYSQMNDLDVRLVMESGTFTLADKQLDLSLFRIIQELITNSIKHGKASVIEMQFKAIPEGFTIQYKDNGKGVDFRQIKHPKGLGMKNIESRLNIINGTWTYHSVPGEGFQAFLTIKTLP